jgi:uncharacterized membrane protein YqjE
MHNQQKSMAEVAQELKVELRDFVTTRLSILKHELKEKSATWKVVVPMLALAAFCALASFTAVNIALLAFLRGLFEGPYAWCYSALILAGIYLVAAAGLYWFGRRELVQAGMVPERTLRVLKQDQLWLQNEARTQV